MAFDFWIRKTCGNWTFGLKEVARLRGGARFRWQTLWGGTTIVGSVAYFLGIEYQKNALR